LRNAFERTNWLYCAYIPLPINGKAVNDAEPKNRVMAMVFQSYAPYPHMIVANNMAFRLKLRKA
jgi:ABC-type sugar transport system ATPase subunit